MTITVSRFRVTLAETAPPRHVQGRRAGYPKWREPLPGAQAWGLGVGAAAPGPEASAKRPESRRLGPKLPHLWPKSRRLGSSEGAPRPQSRRRGPDSRHLRRRGWCLRPKMRRLGPKSRRLGSNSRRLRPELPRLGPESRRLRPNPARLTAAPATTYGPGYSWMARATMKPAPAAAIMPIDPPKPIRGFRSSAT